MSDPTTTSTLGPKTRAAYEALLPLLDEVQRDGQVDDEEIAHLYAWRQRWRTVARRAPLRPFTDWLDQALADGEVSPEEVGELRGWIASLRETLAGTSQPTGDAWLAMRARPSWRDEPSTARQVSFLLDLGATEAECRGLTKGKASDRIDELLALREQRRAPPPPSGPAQAPAAPPRATPAVAPPPASTGLSMAAITIITLLVLAAAMVATLWSVLGASG